jgi:hypothetical protein
MLGVFKIVSSYTMKILSHKLGLAAIRVMYLIRWVQNDPSVRGAIVELDILARLDKFKELDVADTAGRISTWAIQKNVRLADFARNGMAHSLSRLHKAHSQ